MAASARRFRVAALGSVILAALFAVTGCATAPKIRAPETAALRALLSPTADAYVNIDVPENLPLVRDLLSKLDVAPQTASLFVDRTQRFVASARRTEGRTSFEAIAFGAYPSWAANFQLSFHSEWKRQQGAAIPGLWWWAERSGALQLAIPDDRHLLLSNGDMSRLYARLTEGGAQPGGTTVAAQASARFETASVAVLLPHPAGLLPIDRADEPRFPVRSVLVTLSPTAPAGAFSKATANASVGSYNAVSLLTLRSDGDARLLSVLLRLFIASGGDLSGSAPGESAVPALPFSLEGAAVRTEGAQLELSNITLSVSQINDLLALFAGGGKAGAAK